MSSAAGVSTFSFVTDTNQYSWPTPPPVKKSKTGCLIVGLVLGGILMFIAIIVFALAVQRFLANRSGARDLDAQSSARNALAVVKAVTAENDNYAEIDAESLNDAEPWLQFVEEGTAVESADEVIVVSGGQSAGSSWVVLIAKSAEDNCFAVGVGNSGATSAPFSNGQGTMYGSAKADGSTCDLGDLDWSPDLTVAWADA